MSERPEANTEQWRRAEEAVATLRALAADESDSVVADELREMADRVEELYP